jgi:hypothetical protein
LLGGKQNNGFAMPLCYFLALFILKRSDLLSHLQHGGVKHMPLQAKKAENQRGKV